MAQIIDLGDKVFGGDPEKTRRQVGNAMTFFKEFMEPSDEPTFVDTYVNLSGKMFASKPGREHFKIAMFKNDIEMTSEHMCMARPNRRGRKLMEYAKNNGGRVPRWHTYIVNYSLIW